MEMLSFDDFAQFEIRVGTVLSASFNQKARDPAYVMEVDFGDFGVLRTSAQIAENYEADLLVGEQVTAVLNFPPKRVAGVKSEILVLAVVSDEEGTVLIGPKMPVTNGCRIL